MSGPPAVRPSTRPAPSVNRALQPVLVRLHNGDLAGRVSIEFAERLCASGAALPVGRERLRYLRLLPGIAIERSSLGWAIIEEARRKHGDNAVRRGVMAIDRRPLKWQSPKQGSLWKNVPRGSAPQPRDGIAGFFFVAMHSATDSDLSAKRSDSSARAALDSRTGHTLTDAEWSAASARLLQFAGIMRAWDQKTPAPQRGNVEVLCQREP